MVYVDDFFTEAKGHPIDIDGYFHTDVSRVELYPHYAGLIAVHDQHGNALQFPSAFRTPGNR